MEKRKACRRKIVLQRLKSKLETTSKNHGGSGSSGLTYGYVLMMGWRRVMEDAVTVAPPGWSDEGYSFFGVYDGHGGVKVAQTCKEKMHGCLAGIVEKAKKDLHEGGVDWKRVMAECFRTVDEEIEMVEENDRKVGSTAVVMVVTAEEMVVANCGDSRAVLCRDGVAVPLSNDHKPDKADERERIEAAGGMILNWNGWRVEGILSTSRSLGDHYLKPYVTPEPEVTVTRRSESDEFLIIASDGLFDTVCNDIACEVVKKCFGRRRVAAAEENSAPEAAAAALAQLALAKGSKDNISVIVVQLKR